ncbi:hypothetical protein C8J56DRAFT_1029185 [Mycena floridula]|nr:hypothetical protein C8J56DRAFT_1029185 [Mycena floridula]
MAFLPMPTPLFVLHCLSFALSIVVFPLALVTYSILSEVTAAGTSLITFFYQTAIVILAFRRRYRTPGLVYAYTTGSVVWAYVILTMWGIVLVMVIQTTMAGPGSVKDSEVGSPFNFSIQVGQLAVISLQIVIMAVLALHRTIVKRQQDKEERSLFSDNAFGFNRSDSIRSIRSIRSNLKRQSNVAVEMISTLPAAPLDAGKIGL